MREGRIWEQKQHLPLRQLYRNNYPLGGQPAIRPGQTLVIAYRDPPGAGTYTNGYAYRGNKPGVSFPLGGGDVLKIYVQALVALGGNIFQNLGGRGRRWSSPTGIRLAPERIRMATPIPSSRPRSSARSCRT